MSRAIGCPQGRSGLLPPCCCFVARCAALSSRICQKGNARTDSWVGGGLGLLEGVLRKSLWARRRSNRPRSVATAMGRLPPALSGRLLSRAAVTATLALTALSVTENTGWPWHDGIVCRAAAMGVPPLPPGVRVYRGPVANETTKTIQFNVAAPAFQKNMGDWGSQITMTMPSGALAAAAAGRNSTSDPSAFAAVRSVLLVLPVEAGGTDAPYGDGLGMVTALGYADRVGAVVAQPRFTSTPWFCDGSHAAAGAQPTLQASYVREVVAPLARMYCANEGGPCPVDLIGFSKSGWGALSLLLSNATAFRRAAAWDAPSMLSTAFCEWMLRPQGGACDAAKSGCLWDMMTDIGDCAAWARCAPHELVPNAPAALRASNPPRIFLAGQHYFGNWPGNEKSYLSAPGAPFNHTVDMHAWMTAHGVAHAYNDTLDPGKHEWSDVWIAPALDFLAGGAVRDTDTPRR